MPYCNLRHSLVSRASITQIDNRDYFKLRVAVDQKPEDENELPRKFKAQVRGVCRVKLDEVEFVGVGEIAADAPGMIDAERMALDE